MSLMDKFTPKNDDIAFSPVQEPWTIYKLEDGTTVRVRVMLVRAKATGRVHPNGLPDIEFNFQQVLDVEPTEEMKARMLDPKLPKPGDD